MLNLLPRDEKYFDRFTEMARPHPRERRGSSPASSTGVAGRRPSPTRSSGSSTSATRSRTRSCAGIDRTFITPIDREDIHQLAVRLDDVIDLIDGTVRRLSLFNDRPSRRRSSPDALGDHRHDHPGAGRGRLAALRKQKGVMEHCIRIKQLENEGDVAYHGGRRLALPGPDRADRGHQVEGHLRQHGAHASTRASAVAHVLESVVLKHS